jgi:hypothetical protein
MEFVAPQTYQPTSPCQHKDTLRIAFDELWLLLLLPTVVLVVLIKMHVLCFDHWSKARVTSHLAMTAFGLERNGLYS